MRKRNWTLTPWFIIFSVIMFAMAVVSYDYSPVVFYIELGVSVLSLAVAIYKLCKKYGKKYSRKYKGY